MPNIIFKLNNNDQVKITKEEFDALDFSKIISDQSNTFIDLGIRGFQKYNLISWGPEEVKETEGPVQ